MAFNAGKKFASEELRELLELKYREYNQRSFIENDPVSIPHLFTKKEDIEIAGLLAATIAWGNRASILKSANNLMALMDHSPMEFISHFSRRDEKRFLGFTHRTFNGRDCLYFLHSLKNIYRNHGGLESCFGKGRSDLKQKIIKFRSVFFELPHEPRLLKHVSDPGRGSAAKRLCMFLRWMVRKDKPGVDFGIWKSVKTSELMLPLDVHTGNVSRKLGLLTRKQDDWQAVEEVTAQLRYFDPSDPVKYDFALFGMGVNKEFEV